MASSMLDVASNTLVVVDDSPHTHMHNVYKGKTARSWQHLPGEIVRLITTYYLLDVSATAYCPTTWEARELWPQRFAFTALRDAQEIERVMHLFPSWKHHLENHLFWNKACAVLDPMGSFNHLTLLQPTAGSNGTLVQRISLYRHYRSMLDASCAICRINFPYNSEGLGAGSAKRSTSTPGLGVISLCKEHRKSTTFCGNCLREAPRTEIEDDYATSASGMPVCCVENEDDETWPGVEATCRQCRTEAFWRRVNVRPEWREAVDSHRWASLDWETRQSVESFLDLGEGTIRDVLQVAEEKHWLRKYTKLADMLQQAVAASKYASRAEAGEAYGSDEELSEDDMDDPEMLSITEDAGGIRELALSDWARNRILDGHWISPADDWYNHTNQGRPRLAPARHPCPWNRRAVYEGAVEDQDGDTQELQHPRPRTHLAPHPPSYPLCEHTYRAFQRQMREILLPPLRNIVRKLVMECTEDGTDPAMRAVRMSIEDVVQELRDESVWYNGIDWLERRANARIEEERLRAKDKDDDDSSSSSRSGGSHTTSPVLSTTTLQTTPSPPPLGKEDEIALSSPLVGAPLASPVSKMPELLRPIPFIPVTTGHMPHYSMEALTFVWREACAPLYQCQCSICERAMLNANMVVGATVPTQAQLVVVAPVPTEPKQPPVEIKIVEAPTRTNDAEVEEEEDDLDESEDESGDGESERGDDACLSVPESPAPLSSYRITSRKRRSSDAEFDEDSDILSLSTDPDADQSEPSERSRTPPKRIRREGSYELVSSPSVTIAPPASSSPLRQRKRSSEELEDESSVSISGKRMRAEVVDRPLSKIVSPHTTPTGPRVKAIVSGRASAS